MDEGISERDPFADVACALCGATQAPTQMATANGHPVCLPCLDDLKRETKASQVSSAVIPTAVVGGLIGAMLGASVWGGIAIATDVEIGYIAVLVGFLSGVGVKLGARGALGGPLPMVAAACSLVGLVAAKYLIAAHIVTKAVAEQGGPSLGYLDSQVVTIITENFGSLLGIFDILWVVLAVGAAMRVPAGQHVNVQ